MTTNFSTKRLSKNKFSKRILGLESLENRELLSINPLGVDAFSAPDFVQSDAVSSTAQNFQTENASEVGTFEVEATPAYGNALTDSIATPSGLTTNQITLTWGKPAKYVESGDANDGWKAALPKGAKYSVNIFDDTGNFIKTVDAGTKTSYVFTGLTADTEYKFTVTTDLTLTNPADKTATAAKTDVVIVDGTFKTIKAGDAADVTVGSPTDVKATYVKASGSKPASVKVTWKAPANYTGSYEVTLSDGTDTVTRKVNPGSKLEITQGIDSTFVAGATGGDESDAKLAKDTSIKVIVTPIATNKISSTPTYVNTGTVTVASVQPDAPATPTAVALANTPSGTTVTLAAGSGTGATPVGFYVGIGATAPVATTAADRAKLVYVPVGASSTTVDLKVATGDKVWAYAVAADGTISVASSDLTVSSTDMTADIASPLAATEYKAADNVKSVVVTADSTVKNKYTVKWAAAKDVTKTTDPTGATIAAGDAKYEVIGYRVTATSTGGLATQVVYVAQAAQSSGAEFTDLTWGAGYTFKVEALITKTVATTTDFTTTPTITQEISTGASSKATTVAKSPTIADSVTVALKTGSDDTITISGTTVGTTYIVTITDANKAVLGTSTITATNTSEDVIFAGTTGVIGSNLTPKAKYSVTVQTVGSVPGTISKGKIATITATDFVSATLKADTKATTINSVSITVAAPTKGAGSGDTYYVEYTNVVDAKGKADWNAANVYTGTGTTAAAVTGTITIGKLNPGSQYFFRVVTVDKAYTGSTGGDWDDMTKVSTSKELKIKTAVLPLPTIAKNGFALDSNSEFGLKLAGNSMARVDALAAAAKQVLGALKPAGADVPVYVYTLIASTDSKMDKATGKLLGAQTVTAATTSEDTSKTSSTDKKVTDLTSEAVFKDIFSVLGINDTNFSSVKGLNVQVQVDVYYGDSSGTANGSGNSNSIHFTLYSKASKVALPKWFV
ncbi:MAG: hypothetical protein LBK82_00900 [Planctomycetaceae bacterium]|jgi:hypothetical protein|nr:hypothetical protein [Planctomycetaceae bacterium]